MNTKANFEMLNTITLYVVGDLILITTSFGSLSLKFWPPLVWLDHYGKKSLAKILVSLTAR